MEEKKIIADNADKNGQMNTVYIFIDASNVWNAVKSVKKFIEYKYLKDYFKKNFNAGEVEIFYYDAYPQRRHERV